MQPLALATHRSASTAVPLATRIARVAATAQPREWLTEGELLCFFFFFFVLQGDIQLASSVCRPSERNMSRKNILSSWSRGSTAAKIPV